MSSSHPDALLWEVRTFIYAHFAERARAPQVAQIAEHFQLPLEVAGQVLEALDAKHTLLLEPGTHQIRLANPFSAIPTAFLVTVAGQTYWANCAWDAFGIPAALRAPEATLHAKCAQSGEPLQLQVQNGAVVPTTVQVHFTVPFKNWYDNLVFT